MSNVTRNLLQGIGDGLPFALVVGPFAMLFGVVATEAGLSVVETLGFSIVVIAGAAQFTALSLMQENAPTVIVLATSLAVNLRMAMYSASLTPYLGEAKIWQRALVAYFTVDQSFALSHQRFEDHPEPLLTRLAYFFGVVIAVAPVWYAGTLVGALGGAALPPWLALDFAVPITFLALLAPALKTKAHWAAGVTSCVAALGLMWVPYGLGLLIAAAIAIAVGAEVERRQT